MPTPPHRKEKPSALVLYTALPFLALCLFTAAGIVLSARTLPLPRPVAALFLGALGALSVAAALRLRVSRRQPSAAPGLPSAQSDFLARISHDLRTPLNAIVGLTALAQGEEGNPAQTNDYLSQIASSARYLLSLASDVLDISCLERGELELHAAPYPLSEFEESVRALTLPLCAEKHQHFTFTHSKEWPTLFVDRVRFHQIFFNLLSNAVKYTPEGGSVSFDLRLSKLPNGRVSLDGCVRDTGIGISREYLAHIFEPYSRDARVYEQGAQGTGLGLAIVKALVDRMDGRISVQSELGKGSAFFVHLELFAAMQAPAPTSPASAIPPGALADCRVLLAEDNAVNAMITARLLEREGVQVERAENGRVALDRFCASPVGYFDAVLMDIRMPEMDGLSAAKGIRLLDRADAGTVPILALTADAFGADVQRALAAGMNDHLTKPVEPAQLYRALARQLRRIA